MSKEKPPTPKLISESRTTQAPTSFSVVSNRVEGPDGLVATRAEGSLHIGPLPSPETLREYQQISPAILDGIVEAFVEQGRNRRANERWVYQGGVIRSMLGVVFAFIIGMTALLGGIYLVLQGHSVAGTIFGGFGIAGLIEAFLEGTRLRKKREEAMSEDEEGEDSPS